MGDNLLLILKACAVSGLIALLVKQRSPDTRKMRLGAWWEMEGLPIAMLAFFVVIFWLGRGQPSSGGGETSYP